MSDFLNFSGDPASREPFAIFLRLVIAMVMGAAVAFVYRRTRYSTASTPSFTVTLVLLTILIAMVTQVIGDNVARAFSLVGALSIVRFRTVVRDTQDTAYVIFSVAVGMAVGAAHPWLGVGALVVVGFAAWVMRERAGGIVPDGGKDAYLLQVRVGIGHDPQSVLKDVLDGHLRGRSLRSLTTARQGLAVDVTYRGELVDESRACELVRALNRIEGVQNVTLQREGIELE